MSNVNIVKTTEPSFSEQAKQVLKSGGIVIYPSDTCYGIAVNALNQQAIQNVYTLKGRENTKPLHVNLAKFKEANRYTYIHQLANTLATKFLPGPLTIVLKKCPDLQLSNLLTANKPTVGLRVPDCVFCKELAKIYSTPYTATSANKAGADDTYSVESILKQFENDLDKIDLIVDGGELPKVAPSTVVDLSNKELNVLREGPISLDQLKAALAS